MNLTPTINYLNLEQNQEVNCLIKQHLNQLEAVCHSIKNCYVAIENARDYQKSGTSYRVTLHLSVDPNYEFLVVRNPDYAQEYESWESLIKDVFTEAQDQIIELI
ncbi:cold-shock DNA-binding domain protein [Stanieria sp. NIES-3757]|nr:cold-shock DNA-binding domain protein [Stanieria sp. NIES-3757]